MKDRAGFVDELNIFPNSTKQKQTTSETLTLGIRKVVLYIHSYKTQLKKMEQEGERNTFVKQPGQSRLSFWNLILQVA